MCGCKVAKLSAGGAGLCQACLAHGEVVTYVCVEDQSLCTARGGVQALAFLHLDTGVFICLVIQS